MIDEIVGQAKQNQSEYHGNRFKKVDSASAEAESKKGKTTKQLAEINLKKWCLDPRIQTAEKKQTTSEKRNDITSGSADPEVESERTNVKLPRYNPRMVTGEFPFSVAPPLHQNNKIVLGNG